MSHINSKPKLKQLSPRGMRAHYSPGRRLSPRHQSYPEAEFRRSQESRRSRSLSQGGGSQELKEYGPSYAASGQRNSSDIARTYHGHVAEYNGDSPSLIERINRSMSPRSANARSPFENNSPTRKRSQRRSNSPSVQNVDKKSAKLSPAEMYFAQQSVQFEKARERNGSLSVSRSPRSPAKKRQSSIGSPQHSPQSPGGTAYNKHVERMRSINRSGDPKPWSQTLRRRSQGGSLSQSPIKTGGSPLKHGVFPPVSASASPKKLKKPRVNSAGGGFTFDMAESHAVPGSTMGRSQHERDSCSPTGREMNTAPPPGSPSPRRKQDQQRFQRAMSASAGPPEKELPGSSYWTSGGQTSRAKSGQQFHDPLGDPLGGVKRSARSLNSSPAKHSEVLSSARRTVSNSPHKLKISPTYSNGLVQTYVDPAHAVLPETRRLGVRSLPSDNKTPKQQQHVTKSLPTGNPFKQRSLIGEARGVARNYSMNYENEVRNARQNEGQRAVPRSIDFQINITGSIMNFSIARFAIPIQTIQSS